MRIATAYHPLLRAAIEAGASYGQIAGALGVTKQTVYRAAVAAGCTSPRTHGRQAQVSEAAAVAISALLAAVTESHTKATTCPLCKGAGCPIP